MHIIWLKKWYLNHGCRDRMTRTAKVYAALHPDRDSMRLILTPAGKRMVERVLKAGGAFPGWWALDHQEDEWEAVPEGEWPDEVCAVLAKEALLGEAYEDD